MRRILFQETDFDALPTPPEGFKYIGFNGPTFSQKGGEIIEDVGLEGPQGPVGPVGPQGPAGSGGGGGGGGVTEVTYSELETIIGSASLTPGSYYLITDFKTCYDQPDYNIDGNAITGDNYRDSDVHPLMVLAISDDKLAVDAYQPDYPKDKIKYDFTWNQTEVSGGTAYGRITERIDEFNNRTDYDHRNVRFKRYRSRFLDGTVNGRIISMNEGVIIGTGSNFTNDFTTSSVVFLESLNPKFYKVTDIISATQMTVEGVNYDNFSHPIGYRLQQTYLEQSYTPGSLYYFNDSGDNGIIDDGGNDMYDGANILNTNLQNQIPYTHTQMVGIEGQALLEDFTYDGTVEVGDSYFGEGSSYFTNTYPGLFVMAAYDVSVTDFSITGNIGADGGGDVEVAEYTWEGYKIFVKKVFDAGDPSINHIIIVNSTDELIERTYDASSGDDDHELANLDNVTQIHYLLFGLAGGIKSTDVQIENVYQTYLNMIDNVSISNTLTTLNSDFTDITDNLPPNATIFTSLRVRQSNVAEDNSFFREILTFDSDLGVEARNNYIGNACDSWEWDERDFMLPNNVFTNAFDNNVDIYDNHFGDRFVDNTFGDDVYENVVGADFRRNMCEDRFDRNQIGSNFYNNEFYATEFETNVVGENFNNNTIIQDYNDVYDNNIGSNFGDNRFFSESRFYRNRVGISFVNNRIHDDVYNNDIGNDFSNNDIYRQFYKNRIGNYFGSNDFYNNFYDNQIDNGFDSNTIGLSSNIGGSDFYRNKMGVNVKGNLFSSEVYSNILGDNFANNQVGLAFNRNVFGVECVENDILDYFQDNHIGNQFSFNVIQNDFRDNLIGNNFNDNGISDNFTYNSIGNRFNNNTISNDFGFGGAQAYGNRIGNYFENNTIGEYFYNNDIRDLFINNTVGHHFQNNTIQVQNLDSFNFITNYGNIISFTDNTGASPSIPGTDGTYNAISGIGVYGQHGHDANFNIVVSGSVVTSVSLNASGFEYSPSDTLTILGHVFGGTDGDDIIITVGSVSTTPAVYGNQNTVIFKNSFGNHRLSYYDENDVLTITNLDV